MKIRVFKKTENKGKEAMIDWPSKCQLSNIIFSENMNQALQDLNKEGVVEDGDFLVNEDGLPYMVTENCSYLSKFSDSKVEISYGGAR